ncbi:MAG: hypothetical protein V3V78_01585 [Candidatus Woesearchaeota archaeon]
MRFTDLFKTRKKAIPEKRGLEVPAAPPSKDELPTFPSPGEIPEFKKQKAPDLELPDVPKGPSPTERAEDYAIQKTRDELEERDDLRLKKPIFVYLESYRELMNEVSSIQNTLKEGSDSLSRVSEFKEDQDKEFNKWESQLKDIQRKLLYADKALFAAQK